MDATDCAIEGTVICASRAEGLVARAGGVQDRAPRVLDVGRNDGLGAVIALDLHLERLDVLEEERRLSVGAVVDEEIPPLRDAVVARRVQVAERVPSRVGHVAAGAGVRPHT